MLGWSIVEWEDITVVIIGLAARQPRRSRSATASISQTQPIDFVNVIATSADRLYEHVVVVAVVVIIIIIIIIIWLY